MTARVPTYEEVVEQVHGLTRIVNKLREMMFDMRSELGEQGDGKSNRPLHTRVEELEHHTFHKRQDT